ncbi:MAG: LacI family transcriptional regulator [Clostridiales bacterium]|nr:LacI family transcriptional regulator [Clostridiales bacterium]
MTVREIAAVAGVSPAAVSLVLNHKKGVSEETRKKVQEVVDTVGYTARVRVSRSDNRRVMVIKFHTHGITEENQGFIASMIDRIEGECRKNGFDLVMNRCRADEAEETIRELLQNPPMGVILIGTELQEEHYHFLNLFGSIPLVVLDNDIHYGRTDSVVMSNVSIGMDATLYLYELGHRDIGYFRFSLPIHNCEDRYRGYLAGMEKAGLQPKVPVSLAPTMNGAYEDMKRLLEEGKYVPHGAAVADNDTIAIGAIRAIMEAGYNVPGDISVVGIDDIPYSAVMMPPLTTMRVSRKALGTMAVDLLLERIRHPEWPPMHIKVDGRLVVRSSTAKAKGGEES